MSVSPPRPKSMPATGTRALREFLATEAAGGVLLLIATATALIWANSPWRDSYETLWHTDLGLHLGRFGFEMDLHHWVNDGLMAVFFLVVGLEIKRELLLGELRDPRRAALPVAAAIGGMLLPAVLFLLFNGSGDAARGWGIPMATDIAFAIGVLAFVAPGVPSALRLFLLTLAIVDDLGSIVVIAVFYSSGIDGTWLGVAVAIVVAIVLLRRVGLSGTTLFAPLGIGLWLAVHNAGIHATIAGVVMGLLAPATATLSREIVRSRGDEMLDVFTPKSARETTRLARQSVSQLEWLEHQLHGLSSFVIVPIFALANAGIVLSSDSLRAAASSPVTLGVVAALVIGKTVGITAGAWVGVRTGLASIPDDLTWRHLIGAAALGGIGFTVSLFIADLAFEVPALIEEAKVGILVASVIAAALGTVLLRGAVGATPERPASPASPSGP